MFVLENLKVIFQKFIPAPAKVSCTKLLGGVICVENLIPISDSTNDFVQAKRKKIEH